MADDALAMPPALQTTKRKFYKLLDGLNTSSSSLPRPTTANTSRTTLDGREPKRVRVSLQSARAVSITRPTSVRLVAAGSRATSRATARSQVGVVKVGPPVVPNYQPYSPQAFLDRLKTFSDVKLWTYKPSEISELAWAKRGWICEGNKVDTVACKGGCEARIAVRLSRGMERARAFGEEDASADKENDRAGELKQVKERQEDELDWLDGVDEALLLRYQELIINGHLEDCLWRKAGCKDDIYRIRMGDATIWQSELKERYKSLIDINAALPDHLKLPESKAISDSEIKPFELARLGSTLLGIVQGTNTHPTASIKETGTDADLAKPVALNTEAATLALFGWHGSSPHKIHLASCSRCFQRVGLWLYSSEPTTKALPAAQSGIADGDVLQFDLAGLHRDHCPWINAESQAGLGQFRGLAAWEILVRMVEARELISEKAKAQTASDPAGVDNGGVEVEQRPYAEVEAEDRARESKLARLKRAFTFRKDKRTSWRAGKNAA